MSSPTPSTPTHPIETPTQKHIQRTPAKHISIHPAKLPQHVSSQTPSFPVETATQATPKSMLTHAVVLPHRLPKTISSPIQTKLQTKTPSASRDQTATQKWSVSQPASRPVSHPNKMRRCARKSEPEGQNQHQEQHSADQQHIRIKHPEQLSRLSPEDQPNIKNNIKNPEYGHLKSYQI